MGLKVTVPDSLPIGYVKSSRSCQTECVEVARRVDGVYVRDSKDPAGPRLFFDNEAWTSFVEAVRSGALRALH